MDKKRHYIKERPPRLALWLLRLGLPGQRYEAVCGDLEEEWREQIRRTGKRAARRWFWHFTLQSVFPNRALASETTDARERRHRGGFMDEIRQNVRYAWRMLWSKPAFTAVAVLTIALGIGANTSIFSIVEGVLLRPLPYRDVDRIVTLWQHNTKDRVEREDVAPANFVDWRAQNTVFTEMVAINPFSLDYTGGTEPESIRSANVTRGFFEILGVQAARGRTFTGEEHTAGHEQVVVLTHGLWLRKFGGDPEVVGRVISLDRKPYTIVGILPQNFLFRLARGERARKPEMFAPQVVAGGQFEDRVSTYFEVIAQLKPGVQLQQARAEMESIAARLAAEHPHANMGVGITLVPLVEQTIGAVRPALLVLLGAVGFVLLIACVNVANLLLARAAERQRELAIRSAMGASRGQLLVQLMTESAMLSVLGAVGGLVLARWLIPFIVSLSPADVPRIQQVGLNSAVLLFSLGAAVVTAIVFGIAPAVQATRAQLQGSLKEGGAGARGATSSRLRNTLIVTEVALATVLLVGAGLLMRSFMLLLNVDRGFDQQHTVAFEVYIWDYNEKPEQRIAYLRDVAERIRTLPGVKGAGSVSGMPFLTHTQSPSVPCNVEGRPALPAGQAPTVYSMIATPDYFQAMNVPVLGGRLFRESDDAKAPRVAMINTTMARILWPSEDPVGRRFTVPFRRGPVTYEVIGIVGDSRHRLDKAARPEFFQPHAQNPHGSMTIVARTEGDPVAQLANIKARIWEVNPNQPFYNVATMNELVAGSVATRRFNLLLLGGFSALALALAAVGIYGVISFATSQRTQEIGVRMALGARPADILSLMVGAGMRPALAGVAIGVVAGLGLTRVLSTFLFEVTPRDPITFAGVASLLLAVALTACAIPARRASRVDPLVALRYE